MTAHYRIPAGKLRSWIRDFVTRFVWNCQTKLDDERTFKYAYSSEFYARQEQAEGYSYSRRESGIIWRYMFEPQLYSKNACEYILGSFPEYVPTRSLPLTIILSVAAGAVVVKNAPSCDFWRKLRESATGGDRNGLLGALEGFL